MGVADFSSTTGGGGGGEAEAVGIGSGRTAAGSAREHAATTAVVPSAASVTARRSIERLGRITSKCIRDGFARAGH